MRKDKEMKSKLLERYPIGSVIKLIKMNDPFAVTPGTLGIVEEIDDIGNIHIRWENGRLLALVPGVDSFKRIA